jgi:DNA modification methylase
MAINKLILGDCLEVLKTIDSETIDLIYIDPPFFSNKNYEVIWNDTGEIRSFQDRWAGGIENYIAWLKDRIIEMHRILKPTGSILVHCDWHAHAYIRVLILDKVFGYENFRDEIIWYYSNKYTGNKTDGLVKQHDIILRYSKSNKFIFNIVRVPSLHAGRTTSTTHRQNVDGVSKKVMKRHEDGSLVHQNVGNEKNAGTIFEIPFINSQAKERIGYPTQKPQELLERLIKVASNEGDTVLDCFVGGGTTVAVADKLNRNWIGIDQSPQAIKVTEFRLNMQQGRLVGKMQDIFAKPFTVVLHKYDYDTLRFQDAFEFENWIVGQFGGQPNLKQRGDLGLDGRTKDNQPIQVKRSDGVGRNVIDNFHSAVMRYDKALYEKNKTEQKPVGFIIAFSFGKGAIQEVARLKVEENVLIKLVTVEEIVPIAKKPSLKVEITDLGTNKDLREIAFLATGESETGVQFYAWQFDYQDSFMPEILFDKQGRQTHKFKAGEHKIAVKVVDNEGLESLEVIKLKINGVVERN